MGRRSRVPTLVTALRSRLLPTSEEGAEDRETEVARPRAGHSCTALLRPVALPRPLLEDPAASFMGSGACSSHVWVNTRVLLDTGSAFLRRKEQTRGALPWTHTRPPQEESRRG